jgi:hypothetical protein
MDARKSAQNTRISKSYIQEITGIATEEAARDNQKSEKRDHRNRC